MAAFEFLSLEDKIQVMEDAKNGKRILVKRIGFPNWLEIRKKNNENISWAWKDSYYKTFITPNKDEILSFIRDKINYDIRYITNSSSGLTTKVFKSGVPYQKGYLGNEELSVSYIDGSWIVNKGSENITENFKIIEDYSNQEDEDLVQIMSNTNEWFLATPNSITPRSFSKSITEPQKCYLPNNTKEYFIKYINDTWVLEDNTFIRLEVPVDDYLISEPFEEYASYKVFLILEDGPTPLIEDSIESSSNPALFSKSNLDTYQTGILNNTVYGVIFNEESNSWQVINNDNGMIIPPTEYFIEEVPLKRLGGGNLCNISILIDNELRLISESENTIYPKPFDKTKGEQIGYIGTQKYSCEYNSSSNEWKISQVSPMTTNSTDITVYPINSIVSSCTIREKNPLSSSLDSSNLSKEQLIQGFDNLLNRAFSTEFTVDSKIRLIDENGLILELLDTNNDTVEVFIGYCPFSLKETLSLR